MSEQSTEQQRAQAESQGSAASSVVGQGLPNGAHRWIRLSGLAGALGNEQGRLLLEEAGSWASTPFWRAGTGLHAEAQQAQGATPDLLVRQEGESVVAIRAPLGWQQDPLVVEVLFEAAGATGCAAYEVVVAADPDYALYLALVLAREGADWTALQPALADRALELLAPGELQVGVPPAGENSLEAHGEAPSSWAENKGDEGVWPRAAGLTPGPWEPPGRQPPPLYVGREVHAAIAAEYEVHHFGDLVSTNDKSIGSILQRLPGATSNKLSEQERLLKPDITNLTRLHLYEIKSEADAAAGAAKLATYLRVFSAAGVPMQAGSVAEPGTMGVLPAPAGFVLYHCLTPGLIVYRYRKALPEPVPLGVGERERTRDLVRQITDWRYWEEVTGLTGAALVLYLLVSEGTRIIPARNLVPVP